MSRIGQAGLGGGGEPEGGRREEAVEERRVSRAGGSLWLKTLGWEEFGAQDDMKMPPSVWGPACKGGLGGGETTWGGGRGRLLPPDNHAQDHIFSDLS